MSASAHVAGVGITAFTKPALIFDTRPKSIRKFDQADGARAAPLRQFSLAPSSSVKPL